MGCTEIYFYLFLSSFFVLRLDLSRRREKKEKREEGEGEKRKAYQPEQRGKEKKIFRGRFPIDFFCQEE